MLGLCCCVGFSLVVASGGYSWLQQVGFSLQSTGSTMHGLQSSQCMGSVVMAHGLSCSEACGIFPDQGSNPCLLCWQADSLPLSCQGNLYSVLLYLSLWPFFSLFCLIRILRPSVSYLFHIWMKYLFPSFHFQSTCVLWAKADLSGQHIVGSCFSVQSATLCLWMGAFSPLTFKVITDR